MLNNKKEMIKKMEILEFLTSKSELCGMCNHNEFCQHHLDHQCIEVMKFFDFHYLGYLMRTDPKLRYDR